MATLIMFSGNNNQLLLRDTKTHNYFTTKDIYAIDKHDTIPAVLSLGYYVYNGTNQAITVTPIVNVFDTGLYPDVLLPSTTVSSMASGYINLPSAYFSANYTSINIAASTAPTTGFITAFCTINYEYTTS